MKRDSTLSLMLAALVVAAAFTGVAAAASSPSIEASPATPGSSATHTVTLTVGSSAAGSLNGFTIDYSNTGVDVSDVGMKDVAKVGIDRGDDNSGTKVDVSVGDDLGSVKHSNNGKTLTLKFGGSYSLKEGDEIVVVLESVPNPSQVGDYKIPLDINPQSSGGVATATLSISEDTSGDQTATPTPTEGDTTQTSTPTEESSGAAEETQTESPSGGDSGGKKTKSTGPGFGAAIAVVALLGAALLASRKDR